MRHVVTRPHRLPSMMRILPLLPDGQRFPHEYTGSRAAMLHLPRAFSTMKPQHATPPSPNFWIRAMTFLFDFKAVDGHAQEKFVFAAYIFDAGNTFSPRAATLDAFAAQERRRQGSRPMRHFGILKMHTFQGAFSTIALYFAAIISGQRCWHKRDLYYFDSYCERYISIIFATSTPASFLAGAGRRKPRDIIAAATTSPAARPAPPPRQRVCSRRKMHARKNAKFYRVGGGARGREKWSPAVPELLTRLALLGLMAIS